MDIENHYEIEKIIDRKDTPQGRLYLVKWKGYSHADNTWEPYCNLQLVTDILQAFDVDFKQKADRKSKNRISAKPFKVEKILENEKEKNQNNFKQSQSSSEEFEQKEAPYKEQVLRREEKTQIQRKLGAVSHHFVKSGQVFYCVEVLGDSGRRKGVTAIASEDCYGRALPQLFQYLLENIRDYEMGR